MEAKLTVWPNKSDNSKQPVFKGFITIDGEEHELAIWTRDKGGYSGSIKPKQQQYAEQSPAEDLGDEIPFN